MTRHIIGLIIIILFSSCAKQTLTSSEKSLLVNPKSFEAYEIYFSNADSVGKYKKRNFLDGGKEFKFEFESSKQDTNDLYIHNVISIEVNKLEAKIAYAAEKSALKIINKGGIKLEKIDDIFTYGDASQFYLLKAKDGTSIGNLFQYRKDKAVYYLVFLGVYFDDKADWEEFIMPKLQAIDEFAEKK